MLTCVADVTRTAEYSSKNFYYGEPPLLVVDLINGFLKGRHSRKRTRM